MEGSGHYPHVEDPAAVERIIVPPQAEIETFGRGGTNAQRLATHEQREDVRLLVAALRSGEIITLVRRRAEDDDDKEDPDYWDFVYF